MQHKPKESDWRLFRKRFPEWRDRHLAKKNHEIASILADESKTPTERFWDVEGKLKKDVKTLTICFDDYSRSKMEWSLLIMRGHGVIDMDDLEEFSTELRERIAALS